MSLFSSFLFGVSANIDAFLLSFSFGIKKGSFSAAKTLCLCLLSLAGTLLSLLFGIRISYRLSVFSSLLLGSSLLILLGCYYCLKYLYHRFFARQTKSTSLCEIAAIASWRETVLLGISLSVNNIGMGIGAGFTGLPVCSTCIMTFVTCFLLIRMGGRMGRRLCCAAISDYADLLSGIILIALGTWPLVSFFRL